MIVKKSIYLLFIVLSITLSSCGASQSSMQTSVATTLTAVPSITPYPTYTIEPTYTPRPTYTPLPTYTRPPVISLPPTETEMIKTKENITPTAIANIPFSPGNENEFRSYLLKTYNTIANNPLDIEDIQILNYETAYAVFIELTNESAVNVFAKQTQKDAYDYGTRLLEDTIIYFEGKDCTAFVDEVFYSDDLYYYSSQDETFYHIGDYYLDHDGWLIRQSYVVASLYEGKKHLDVWNR